MPVKKKAPTKKRRILKEFHVYIKDNSHGRSNPGIRQHSHDPMTFKTACAQADELAKAYRRKTIVMGPYVSFNPLTPEIVREDIIKP